MRDLMWIILSAEAMAMDLVPLTRSQAAMQNMGQTAIGEESQAPYFFILILILIFFIYAFPFFWN